MPMSLEGLKILDLTRLFPGPYASLLLADLGADVIKIERPGRGDYLRQVNRASFCSINRNKKSIILNLKSVKGREIFHSLAKTADVVLEGNRPGVAARLGIDYDQVSVNNPGIIYCSISGPYSTRAGYDINYMGVAGALTLKGRPHRPGILPIADLSSGMFAAVSILAAIVSRQSTGKGQYIDVSMTDGVLSWLSPFISDYQNGRAGEKDHGSAQYDIFQCSDGKYLSLGVLEDSFWKNLCKALGRSDMAEDLRYYNYIGRKLHTDNIYPVLEVAFKSKSRDEWLRILNANDVPSGPVNSIASVQQDPQVLHRKMIMDYPDFCSTGFPAWFSGSPVRMRLKAPEMGEHTEAVLRDLGYLSGEIEALRRNSVI